MRLEKIFIVVPSLSPTGPIKGAVALANELARFRRVQLVALKPGKGVDSPISDQLEVRSLANIKGLGAKALAYRRLVSEASRQGPVASVSLCFSADMANLTIGKLATTLSSIRANNLVNYSFDYGLMGKWLAWFHLKALRRMTHVVALTESMARQIRDISGVSPMVIGNFIDEDALEKFRGSGLERPDEFCFVTVGSLTERKQPHLIIRTVAELRSQNHEVQAHFLGDGPLRPYLEKELTRLGMANHVHIHGYKTEPFDVIQMADAMVLPSLSEGLSRSALEALYLGVPCVLRDVDGNRELIEPGKNGALFNQDSELPQVMLQTARWSRESGSQGKNLLPPHYRQARAAADYLNLLENGKVSRR